MLKKRFTALILVVLLTATFVPFAAAAPAGVTAQAAVVIDFDTGEVLFERDAHSLRVPASMTKSMTAFIAYEEIAAGNLSLDTRIRISANAARMSENNPASRLIAAGAYYTVDELIHLAMLPSSNRASIALAEHISGSEAAFVAKMNETAAGLGMEVRFANSHGAHDHYATAYAMGRLVYEFIHRHPDILRITNATNMVIGGQNQANTNRLIHNRQVAGLDGFKTGTLPRAGFCLQATAVRGGRRIITVVMNSPNNDRRFADTRILMDFAFAEIARRDAARGYDDANRVFVQFNGQMIDFDVPARLAEGRTLVPMRAIFEKLGANVIWNNEARTITAIRDGAVIVMPLGSTAPTVNGQTVTIDVPATAVDGRTLVPLRFVIEALGAPIVWEASTRTVIINTEEEETEEER
ncbi:MAG: stalk domain-containing protein, partial [Oscillospiraceae bacterium]|nr:stalk domain-containing protein [Oscillospiraceae bacterium]